MTLETIAALSDDATGNCELNWPAETGGYGGPHPRLTIPRDTIWTGCLREELRHAALDPPAPWTKGYRRDFFGMEFPNDKATSSAPSFYRPSMAWIPERQVQSSWTEHVPFAFWLVDALRPATIVELGVEKGISYSAFCQAVRHLNLRTKCFAIDTWEGDEHAGYYSEEVYQDFVEFHNPRYREFSKIIRSTFDNALNCFEAGSIDLLHIDGFHTYEAVKHDYETWLPKLARNAVVLFHDTDVRERNFGVYQLWSEITQHKSHFAFLHGHGLGVLGLGSKCTNEVQLLFDARSSPESTAQIRNVFSSLGQALRAPELRRLIASETVRLETQNRILKDEIGTVRQQANVTETETEFLRDYVRVLRSKNLSDIAELENVRSEAQESRAQIDALLRSRSWRLTAPLRSVSRMIGSLSSGKFFEDRPRRTSPRRIVHLRHLKSAAIQLHKAKGLQAKTATSALLLNKYLNAKLSLYESALGQPTTNWVEHATLSDAIQRADLLLAADNFSLVPADSFATTARINIILPALDPGIIFGGYLSVFQFANFLRRNSFVVRFIVVERASGAPHELAAQCEAFFPQVAETIRASEVIDRTRNVNAPVDFSRDDLFVAYSCSTAMFAHNTASKIDAGPFMFYLQEEEGHFHSHNSFRAFSEGVYRLPHLGIYNSPMLKDYFALMRLGNFSADAACNDHVVYRHALSTSHVPTEEELNSRRKRKVLFFARPERHAERNLFEMGLAALKVATEQGLFPADQWEINAIGSSKFQPIPLRGGQRLNFLGRLPLDQYARLLAEYDVGMSLIYSPHPSVPNLELSAAGVPTVTTSFINRAPGSMRAISANLIAVPPTVMDLVAGLREAKGLSFLPSKRILNARFDWPRTWHESFNSEFEQAFWSMLEKNYGKDRLDRLRSAPHHRSRQYEDIDASQEDRHIV